MRRLEKKDIFTIPNILRFSRLLMLPFIVYFYSFARRPAAAAVVFVISGITDNLDGDIARHFHMISDLGKVLDPVADKLTQGVVFICLAIRRRIVLLFAGSFLVTELVKFWLGLVTYKRMDIVPSAKWYGKRNTDLIFAGTVLLLLFPEMPQGVLLAVVCTLTVVNLLCCALYTRHYIRLLHGKEEA